MEHEHGYTKEERTMLTERQVREHILRQENVLFVTMESLLKGTHESCVDGRGEVGVIGTPGGNKGEFVLALTVAERVSGQKVDLSQMKSILAKYCDIFGKFYLHSDYHALGHLQETLGLDSIEEVEKLIKNPPEERKQEILEFLADPHHIGCGHLRLMIEKQQVYEVRNELVQAAIKAFFELLWDKNENMNFVVLDGNHEEGAVVNIFVEGQGVPEMIPTIVPQIDGEQMFVNTPQAAEFMRISEAANIGSIVGFVVDEEMYARTIMELGTKQLLATVGELANGKPVFNVVFQDTTGENFTVEQA